MSDLTARAYAEIDRRVKFWEFTGWYSSAEPRAYLSVLRGILDRHTYKMDGWHIYDEKHPVCVTCKLQDWPCPDVRAVLDALGIKENNV